MNGEDAKERIHFLSEEINFHNNLYYNEDNPVIEDYEYDRLLSELEKLENEFPQFRREDSPTNRVGGKASEKFSQVIHEVPMESLHDSFSHDELREFDRKVRQSIQGKVEYVVEPKIDGL